MNWYIYIRCHERQQRKQTKTTFKIKKVVDENITKCYIDKVASAAMSSLKTERNKQRETSIFILDARQTNFIGEFDPGSG
ncbi:hypothetical protein [Bacillus sp. DHT2]|uniref:hypothetical protein n=1 Tax=Bacillus sp. DHT2 TaxID=2994532 RepID=UPI002248CDE6|nr:hypothetical protein [Bacillus sp. DHT2]